jgi:hypothetical protein
VVEKARELLRSEVSPRASSTAAREQVRSARVSVEDSIFYRQLDIMAFRFRPQKTPGWYAHKRSLLAKGKAVIVQEYQRDREDRERVRRGEAVEATRQSELDNAWKGHLKELDLRYETMLELDKLLD